MSAGNVPDTMQHVDCDDPRHNWSSLEPLTTPRMVAERLVADMRSLHGWKHWAAEWLGWITETLGNDRVLLIEVADVADVQVGKSDVRIDTDVDDVITAPDLTELSRSWCEHDTLALESVHSTNISIAALVVVLELCERCFNSVCLNMFGLAHRVFILYLEQRTTQHLHISQRQHQVNWTREKDIGIGGVCCLRTSNCILTRCPKTCRF